MGKPAFELEVTSGESKFSVIGDLTVQYAQELKVFLFEAINMKGSVCVTFDQTTSIDTATVQMAYAFKKEIEKNGRPVKFLFPANESVLDLLTKTGITKIL